MTMGELVNGEDFYKFKLRDLIELGVILTGVILYLVGGFTSGNADTKANTAAIVELKQYMTAMDNNGTRKSQQGIDTEREQIAENKRRIEALESAVYKINEQFVDMRSKLDVITALLEGKRPQQK